MYREPITWGSRGAGKRLVVKKSVRTRYADSPEHSHRLWQLRPFEIFEFNNILVTTEIDRFRLSQSLSSLVSIH